GRNCVRPGSIRNGRANTATRPGRCSKSPPASCRSALPGQVLGARGCHAGVVMAEAELTERRAGGVAKSPPRRPVLADVEHVLGMLVEIPAALLVAAEIVILFAGVVARYRLHSPLIWSDELASILFLWL